MSEKNGNSGGLFNNGNRTLGILMLIVAGGSGASLIRPALATQPSDVKAVVDRIDRTVNATDRDGRPLIYPPAKLGDTQEAMVEALDDIKDLLEDLLEAERDDH